MENLTGSYSNPKTPKIKYFDGNMLSINAVRGQFHVPIPMSPVFDPYESSESPNTPNPLSPLFQCLRSRTSVPFDLYGESGDGGGSRSCGGRGEYGLPLASIENLMTQPSKSPLSTLFTAPVNVEEDVIVMDGILVKPKSGGSRSRGMQPPSDVGGELGNFKTEKCWHWEQSASCRSGSNCPFAHGKEELRPPRLYKNRKSEICIQYIRGSCKHGSRCRFVHPENPERFQAVLPSRSSEPYVPSKHPDVSSSGVKDPATRGDSTSATNPAPPPLADMSEWAPLKGAIETSLPGNVAPTDEDVEAQVLPSSSSEPYVPSKHPDATSSGVKDPATGVDNTSSTSATNPAPPPPPPAEMPPPPPAELPEWAPQRDGIEISLPGNEAPTDEEVEAQLQSALYGPPQWIRLAAFKEFCPD